MGITVSKKVRFRDHHPFSRRDIESLGGELLITTEKDAVRLEGLGAGTFLELRISANIPEFDGLLEIVLARTSSNNGN